MYILDLVHKCHFLFKVTLSYQRRKQSSAALRENEYESVISVPLCLCVVMSLLSVDIVCFLSVLFLLTRLTPDMLMMSMLSNEMHYGQSEVR